MKKQKGQAIVEFAVVLPLFVLLLFGIIYSGLLFYDYISLSNIARSAAREGAIVQNFESNKARIESHYSQRTLQLLTKLYDPVPYSGTDQTKLVKVEPDPDDENSIKVSIQMRRNVTSGLMEIILPEDYTIVFFMKRDEQLSGTGG